MDNISSLKYGQQLYLYTPYNYFLFGRGFINRQVYLSQQKSQQCLFVFEQKSKNHNKSNLNHETIIYGTELVLKHVFSGHYLSIQANHNEAQPQLYLSKEQNDFCYFQLTPQRNFQQNGQVVTLNSFFAIQSSHYNLKQFCISSFLSSQSKRMTISRSFNLLHDRQIHSRPRHTSQHNIGKPTSHIKNHNHHTKRNQPTSSKHINYSSKYHELTFKDSIKNQIHQNQNQKRNFFSDEDQNLSLNNQHLNNTNLYSSKTSSQVNVYQRKPEEENSRNGIQHSHSLQIHNKRNDTLSDHVKQANHQQHQNRGFKKIKRIHSKQQYQKSPSQQSIQNINLSDSLSTKKDIFSYLKYFDNSQQQQKNLSLCMIQTSQYSYWKVQLKYQQSNEYLKDGDYVQFIYSNKNDGILNVGIQTYPFEIKYELNKGEEEELFSSFFKVEFQEERMYLKHILTDLYFPLNQNNQKTEFELEPICYQQKNQLPIFQIKFGGKLFMPPKSDITTLLPFDRYKVDAFHMNKVNKYPINQIMSCRGVSEMIWIPYFKQYLNKNGKKGQKILKEIQLLKFMIQKLLPKLNKQNPSSSQTPSTIRQQIYKLLFKSCLFNIPIKRYLIQNHIKDILSEYKKQYINDLIIELLENGDGLLEKYITSETIAEMIVQLANYVQKENKKYSMSYMRLFRIFCGTETQSCVRNQNFIFSYFFPGQSIRYSQISSHNITQSHISLAKNKSIKISDQLKFQIAQKDDQIIFISNGEEKSIEYFQRRENLKEKQYLRQYFYLLSDTMRNQNDQTIEKFDKQYQLQLLIKILINPKQQYAFLKGPILSLILTAYISKINKYKFYIFYKKYPKICYKGQLTAQNISQNFTRLLQYIKHEIHTIYFKEKLDRTHFNSTAFKHFLSLIKLSIQCGFWNDENQLLNTIQWLQKVFQYDQNLQVNHQNYQQKLQQSNLMQCKTLAVDIYTLYVDLQINMCISDLLQQSQNTLTNQIVNDKILLFYKKACNWNLNKLIFKICSTSNSQLMKKSLFLFKKIYNIKTIVQEQFSQARKQLKQQTDKMKDKIDFITSQKNIQLSINTQQDCQKFISAIFEKPINQKFSLTNIKKYINNGENIMIENIYQYDKPNYQFQQLCFKLGIHTRIIQTLVNYLNLRKKEQNVNKKEILSNQLFLLLALIKSNLQLKTFIQEYRHLFISLLSDQTELYYVALQILIQIYKENRKLVVSDTKNLQRICAEVSESFKKGTYHLKNKIDMVHSKNKQKKNQRSSLKGANDTKDIPDTQLKRQDSLQLQIPSPLFNKSLSQTSNSIKSQQRKIPTNLYQTSRSRDSQHIMMQKSTKKNQSLYHNPQTKSLTIKDCKLFFFLLTFIRIQNKKIQKNEKIILKYIFNKENLVTLEEKIRSYDTEDNLIGIFKVLIYHFLESLGKNPDIFFAPVNYQQNKFQSISKVNKKISMACIQQQEENQNEYQRKQSNLTNNRRRSSQINNNFIELSQKSLNNLIMSIRFKNWQLKSIVYKTLQNRIKDFKMSELQEFLRLIQMDLNAFSQMYSQGTIYEKDQQQCLISSMNLLRTNSNASNKSQDKKSFPLKYQVEQFILCSPFIIKCLEKVLIKLRNNSKQIKEEVINLLVINTERLFLLRNIFPYHVVQLIEVLPSNLTRLIQEKSVKMVSLKNIDTENLYKIQIDDYSLEQLTSEKYKNVPLISCFQGKQQILRRQKCFKSKNTSTKQLLPQTFMGILQRKISDSKSIIKLQQKSVIFPTKKQTLKKFISNLIKVNSSDSNVLSDQLKTFFLTYLSHSYLEDQNQNVSSMESSMKIKMIDSQNQIFNQENFEKKQDLLIEYDIPLVICTILEEGFRNRYELFSNMFELVNRLLDGGNTKGQLKFLAAFKNDHKNNIFQNISFLISQLLQTIKFYYTNQNIVSSFGNLLNQKSYEFYQTQYQRKVVCQLLGNVFRFLQLLCENNNRKMKNYIFSQYDQNDKVKYLSVNFVQIAIEILHEVIEIIENNIDGLNRKYQKQLLKQVKQNLLPIPNSILDFLIQVCQIPALQNQIYLCRTDFFKVISKIEKLSQYNSKFITLSGPLIIVNPQQNQYSLAKIFFIKNKQQRTTNLANSPSISSNDNILFVYQRKLIILFRSLLEQENVEIIDIMNKKLGNKEFEYFINQSLLHGGLEDIEKLKLLLLDKKLNHHLETIVDILIVKKSLKIHSQLSFTGIKKQIINSLENRIQTININFQNQNLTVYFPSHPLFDLLTDRTKKFFLDKSITFKSRNEKLRDFIISRHVIYQDIQNEKNAQNKMMNDKNMSRLYNMSIGISYVIITLLILFYSVSKSGTVLDIMETQIISGMSLLQLIVTVIYAVLWGINIAPITREKLKTKMFQTNNKSHSQYRREKIKKQRKQHTDSIVFGKYFNKVKQDVIFIKEIYLQESASFHVVLLLLTSLFAFFFEVRVYSFALIFFFSRIELLQSILKAIRLTWKQLLIVCLLSVVFSFIFGFLTINNYIIPLYQNQQIDIDINRINQHCNSIITCIKSLYTQTIIGQSSNQNGDENLFISDLVYWGFFEILLTNIIAAIIIDKFAQQRNAKQKIQNQRHNRCYICSADKSILQRKGCDFNEHVNKTHYLWNYFYYMYTLERLKDNTQFTGIEYWIEHQIKNSKIEWIPLDESKKDDFTDEKIDYLYKWFKQNELLLQANSNSMMKRNQLVHHQVVKKNKQSKQLGLELIEKEFELEHYNEFGNEFQLREKPKKKKQRDQNDQEYHSQND